MDESQADASEMPPPPSAADAPKPAVVGPRNIEVIALRKGFFQSHRKVEGDRFTIPTMKQLGSWMKCVDPKIEEMHQAALFARNRKANSAVD